MNLVSLLMERAAQHPERVALIDSKSGTDRSLTYGELSLRVSAGAARFKELGLARGHTILVFQPVSIELYECILAAFHAGIRVMLADPSAGKDFLEKCCQRIAPDAYFGSQKAMVLRLVTAPLRRIPVAICSDSWFPGTKRWSTKSLGMDLLDVPDDEPALITFTSGSTGQPKAAVRTHGFLLAQHAALSEALHFKEQEVDLITLPVFVLANLASGLTSVIAATNLAKPGFPDAEAVFSQCIRTGVSRCAGSPAFFEAMLKSKVGVPPFRILYTGGAPVYNDLLNRLAAALPEADVYSVYGSTEAEPMAHFHQKELTPDEIAITRNGGGLCAGKPVRQVMLRIIPHQWGSPLSYQNEQEFQKQELPSGEAGEIVVTGEHVLRGYLDGAGDEETKIKVAGDVWHRTGDAGWMDDQGRLWLLGRCSERMTASQAPPNIPAEALRYPFAVECGLREIFPDIRMAALQWADQRTLVIGKLCSAAELIKIESLAKELGIEEVIQMDELPMDRRHNAKIDYPVLREKLSKR